MFMRLRWTLGGGVIASLCACGPVLAAPSPFGPVCSNGAYLGDNGLSPPGQQWESRYIYYCPQGAKVIQLLFAGTYADGSPPVERTLVDPQAMTLSVETAVPPVWDPEHTYGPGEKVSGPVATTNAGGIFEAVAASRGILPTAANTGRWRARSGTRPVPITCGGHRRCVLGTHADAGGGTRTVSFLATDPIGVNIRPGSLIAIRAWVQQSGKQVMANGPSQTSRAGSYQVSGTHLADLTDGGFHLGSGPAHNMGPFAIVGQQAVATPVPTACILGDSRVAGVAGLGLTWAPLGDGGRGYTSDDIGRLVSNISSGGSADNTIAPARYVIQDVKAGRVTHVSVYDPGHYAPPVNASDAGIASAPPHGRQPTHATYHTAGSGVAVDIAADGVLSGSAGIFEDARTFAQGFVQKGLSDAGIPFASFSRSSDRVAIWTSPGGATNRMAAIQKSGCSSVIVGLGIRDSNAGETASTMQSQYKSLAKQLLALGTVKAVYLVTMPPQTASRDHWVTVTGQTPIGFDATRKAVNAWERTRPWPFAGILDAAAPLEVDRHNVQTAGGGYWIVNGTPHFATPDRTHLSPGAAVIAAAAVQAKASTLR